MREDSYPPPDQPRENPPDQAREQRGEPQTAATCPFSTGQRGQVLRFSALAPGALFTGRYRIEERLGAGGAGEVYRVVDQLAQTQLALKVLYPRAGDGGDPLARLRRELRILRELRHPGILRIHDVGESDGLLYLVMDLLEGETLQARLAREGRLPLGEVLQIAEGLLAALAAAHGRGVIHRDVKPGNVFLARDPEVAPEEPGGGVRVVLLDFGLAREAEDLSLTATGHFLGTPEYASPEQARGEHSITAATDVYSAGMVIWEMLAGSPPFAAESAAEMLVKQAAEPLPSWRKSLGALPGWLADLLAWMLEKKSAARPADAGVALGNLRQRTGRGWLRRLGRACVNTRRLTRAALALAALLLLLAALLPSRIIVSSQQARRVSLLGIDLGKYDLPAPAKAAVPFSSSGPFARRYLVGIFRGSGKVGRRRYPPSLPLGLTSVDLLTGRTRPFLLINRLFQEGPPHSDPRYFQSMALTGLQRLPWINNHGKQTYLAQYQCQSAAPHLLLLFDQERVFVGGYDNPGEVEEGVIALRGPDERHALLIFLAINNPLGYRGAVAGWSLGPGTVGGVQAPPYELPLRTLPGPSRFYTFIPGGRGAGLVREGERGIVDRGAREPFLFDLRTGVPESPDDRGGLDPEAWKARQEELLELMRRAEAPVVGLDDEQAALAFERWPAEQRVAPTQESVALERASLYWLRAGRPERALGAERRSTALERGVQGHYSRLVEIQTRLGGYPAAREEADRLDPAVAAWSLPLNRALAFSALLTGTPGDAEHLVDKLFLGPTEEGNYYRTYVCGLQAIHLGRGEELPRCRGWELSSALPEFAFLEALSQLVRPDPDPARALAILEEHPDGGFGTGTWLAAEPLESCLAAMGHGDAPPAGQLEQALARQRDAAKANLLSWYFLVWQEGLLARAALERGDRDAWRHHLKAARSMKGAGPWLEVLAGKHSR